MGNVYDDWMSSIEFDIMKADTIKYNVIEKKKANKYYQRLKNRALVKILKFRFCEKWFYRIKGLPRETIENF